jgi:hypothetical protein
MGTFEIPTITNGNQNVFLADLFARFKVSAKEELKMVEEYDLLMGTIRETVSSVQDAESASKALESFKGLDHVFASKQESWSLLKEKAEKLGLVFTDGSFKVKA